MSTYHCPVGYVAEVTGWEVGIMKKSGSSYRILTGLPDKKSI
uniref:Uncharacterized protein n=1 Tax=Klebsiella pneumoniae TaxID=573 RepID=A0A8B0STH0_KLEPN|nr:hypothetical protein [Klebsiella pneumoniae]